MKEVIIKGIMLYYKIISSIFSRLPLKNKIVIFSNNGETYDCNPKIILENLEKDKKFDLVCIINKKVKLKTNLNINYISNNKYFFAIKSIYHINTCKLLITNTRIKYPEYLKKRKGQKYIQTWHSSLRLKKIEGDAEKYLSRKYLDSAKKDSEKIDYIISGNRFTTEIIKRAFFYKNEILEFGNPRVDYLVKNKNKKELLKKELFHEYVKNNILVYCPTFRNTNENHLLNHDFELWLNLLEKHTQSSWKILIKYHPNSKIKLKNENKDIKIIKNELTAQQLVLISDLVVTDFSSVMFDAIYAEKRCILYAKDFDEYLEKEREVYFKYEELPFELYKDDSFLKKLNLLDKTYKYTYKKFMENIGNFEDGDAMQKLRLKICEIMDK